MAIIPTKTLCRHRYWLGPMTNLLPAVTKPGFAAIHQAAEDVDPEQDSYVSTSGITYREDMKCYGLAPVPASLFGRMRKDDFTLTPSSTPWEEQVANAQTAAGEIEQSFLQFTTADAVASSATSKTLMHGSDPVIALTVARYDPPNGTTPDAVGFGFGYGHFTLAWGSTNSLVVAYLGTDGRARTATRPVKDSEKDAWWQAPKLLFTINPMGNGELSIACSAWAEPWRLSMVATLTPTTYTVSCTSGCWGFHVTQIQFATTGTLTAPYVNTRAARGSDTRYFAIYGPGLYRTTITGQDTAYWNNGAVSATITRLGVNPNNSKEEQYRLTMTGDGWHPGAVHDWQVYYLPALAARTANWIEITSLVDHPTTLTEGTNAAATLDLTLRDHARAVKDYLQSETERLYPIGTYPAMYISGESILLRGQVAIAMTTEYQTEDATPATVILPRFVGIIHGRRNPWAVGSLQRQPLRAVDVLGAMSEGELVHFPALQGAQWDTALRIVAAWCGIPTDRLIAKSTFTTADALDELAQYSGKDDVTLPWTAQIGANGKSLANSICEYGVTLACQPTTPAADTAPDYEVWLTKTNPFPTERALVIDAAMVVTDSLPVTEIDPEVEYSGTYNRLTVIGQDPRGKPIILSKPETVTEPAGGWEYTGQLRQKTVQNQNLISRWAVARVLAAQWRTLPRPGMVVRLALRGLDALRPAIGSRIGIEDSIATFASGYTAALRDYLLTDRVTENDINTVTTTLTCRVIHGDS